MTSKYFLFSCIFTVLQTILQNFYMLDGFWRCCCSVWVGNPTVKSVQQKQGGRSCGSHVSILWTATLYMVIAIFVIALAIGAGGRQEDKSCRTNLQTLNRLPYMVSVRQPGTRSHVCSAILISPKYVVTAAHCVDGGSVYSAGMKPIVHIGATSVDEMDENVEVMLVKESFVHPKWDRSQRSAYNVAVLELEHHSQNQYPTLLTDHFKVQTGQQLTAAGWGAGGKSISVGSEIFGPIKLESQEFISNPHCNKEVLWNTSLPEGLNCGLNDKQTSSCLVDSGSPLLLLDQPHYDLKLGTPKLDFLTAINIDGAPCGTPNKPDIFLELSYVFDWLSRYIHI